MVVSARFARRQHDKSQAGECKCANRSVAPLAGRDPDAVAQPQHRYDRDVGGVEHVLAVEADQEFAADGDGSRRHGQQDIVRT